MKHFYLIFNIIIFLKQLKVPVTYEKEQNKKREKAVGIGGPFACIHDNHSYSIEISSFIREERNLILLACVQLKLSLAKLLLVHAVLCALTDRFHTISGPISRMKPDGKRNKKAHIQLTIVIDNLFKPHMRLCRVPLMAFICII